MLANGRALVKVIIETCLLTDEEKVKVCQIAKEVGRKLRKNFNRVLNRWSNSS